MQGWEREAVLDGAVNKRNLSTGETGEFASENLGFGPEPWGLIEHSHEAASPTGEVGCRKYL